MVLNGTEIIGLIGLPESDDRVLDLIETLNIEVSEIEKDEYDGSYNIELSDTLGIDLTFDNIVVTEEQKNKNIGGLYLNSITFYTNFRTLPYGISYKDNLRKIEEKIGFPANYIDRDENNTLYWMYQHLGWFTIWFENNTFEVITEINIKPYEDPTAEYPEDEGFDEIMKPFER